MKIYTKQGDAGETGLLGGSRVPKTHGRIETYGTLDELNSVIGVALAHAGALPANAPATGTEIGAESGTEIVTASGDLIQRLARVQADLFQLGAELATPAGRALAFAPVGDAETVALEGAIDAYERELPPLKNFILPGGTPLAAHLQLARTVCRRAERSAVALGQTEAIRPEVLRYLNRLSDFLFVAGRFANFRTGVADVPWVARK